MTRAPSANATVARHLVERLIRHPAPFASLEWRTFAQEVICDALDAAPVRRVVPPESLA
jgi:hypothetical protein